VRYLALATDYDGTLAASGRVDDRTARGVEQLRASGRRLVLVTGRIRSDLEAVFPRVHLFDLVVAENGATLWRPGGHERLLGPAPPPRFLDELRRRGVPFDAGRVVVATREPYDAAALGAIRDLGLGLQLVFNKGAVMVLPPGVTKATGLEAAAAALGLTRHEVVAVGDAENDVAMLRASECGVAVDNALPAVKEIADLVTRGARGEGVLEVAERLLADDLADVDPPRHRLQVGAGAGGVASLSPAGTRVVVAGPPGGPRAAVATAIAARLAERGYQLCAVDASGAFDGLPGLAPLGTAHRAPEVDEVVAHLRRSRAGVAVSLRAVAAGERAAFVARLWQRVLELRARAARPHWLAFDDADRLLARALDSGAAARPRDAGGLLLATSWPELLPRALSPCVNAAFALGELAPATLAAIAAAAGAPRPGSVPPPRDGEVLFWRAGRGVAAVRPASPAPATLAAGTEPAPLGPA
jgi:hydroxymethylpyrimidine pyrophosphatase-like HAD family hydrolase